MNKYPFLVLMVIALCGCQAAKDYPGSDAPNMQNGKASNFNQSLKSVSNHADRENYSAVEAAEQDSPPVCVGVWCGCPAE